MYSYFDGLRIVIFFPSLNALNAAVQLILGLPPPPQPNIPAPIAIHSTSVSFKTHSPCRNNHNK